MRSTLFMAAVAVLLYHSACVHRPAIPALVAQGRSVEACRALQDCRLYGACDRAGLDTVADRSQARAALERALVLESGVEASIRALGREELSARLGKPVPEDAGGHLSTSDLALIHLLTFGLLVIPQFLAPDLFNHPAPPPVRPDEPTSITWLDQPEVEAIEAGAVRRPDPGGRGPAGARQPPPPAPELHGLVRGASGPGLEGYRRRGVLRPEHEGPQRRGAHRAPPRPRDRCSLHPDHIPVELLKIELQSHSHSEILIISDS